MSFIGDVIANVGAEVVVTILAAVLAAIALIAPARRMWQIPRPNGPRDITFFVPGRDPLNTRTYRLPIVGIGPVQAIAAVTPSLTLAYWKRRPSPIDVRLADENIRVRDLRGSFISMGGASRNEATKKLLDKYGGQLGIRQQHGDPEFSGDRISLRLPDSSWRTFGGLRIDGSLQEVTRDYALIIRVPNPWNPEEARCLVFAGVHTYGTAAAAQYFIEQRKKPKWWTSKGILCLLEIELDEGNPTKFHEVEFRRV